MKIVTPSGFFYFLTVSGFAAATPASLAAQPQTMPPPPPPAPVIMRTAPPPPVMESPADSADRIRALQEVVTLDVEVTGGSERLWLGNLRVNNQQSGDYNSTMSQARLLCPGQDYERSYGGGLQDRLTLSFQRRDWNRDIDGFYVRISWTHPREACGGGAGQSTVGFEQGVVLRPGETKLLTGDGGLVLKVSRRR